MRFRLFAFAALISLPAVLVTGAGAVFVAVNVPGWIRAEPGRITREYRETAELLLMRPESAAYVGPRKKEWKNPKRIEGRQWGYVEGKKTTCVWLRVGPESYRAVDVAVVRPVPYALVFYVGGSFVALLLAALTTLAVWSFLRFMRERADFLAATAHDLTTPLVGLRLCIGHNDEDARNLVERLLLLVGNINDFLRLGGRRPAQIKTVDLVGLVSEAYAMFAEDYRDLLGGKDVSVYAGRPIHARADELMTLQILWNLFGNDLKYAAPYGSVAVRVSSEGDFALVEFVDEGQGMTPRQMRRAFDRYYRAKTVLQSGKGGFGIGLCTSKEFAHAMGGDLTVKANSPHGCVFTLKLPLQSN